MHAWKKPRLPSESVWCIRDTAGASTARPPAARLVLIVARTRACLELGSGCRGWGSG